MTNIETVIKALENCINGCYSGCPYEYGGAVTLEYCREDLMRDALELLKEQKVVQPKTIPEELKQKMWNALYAEEDKFEEKYAGTEGHDDWFFIYRPWLQKGFDLAIKAIADWEGR